MEVQPDDLLPLMRRTNQSWTASTREEAPTTRSLSTARSISRYCNDPTRWTESCSAPGCWLPWWVAAASEEKLHEWRSLGGTLRQAQPSAATVRDKGLRHALAARLTAAREDYRVIGRLRDQGMTYRGITARTGWSSGKVARAVRYLRVSALGSALRRVASSLSSCLSTPTPLI